MPPLPLFIALMLISPVVVAPQKDDLTPEQSELAKTLNNARTTGWLVASSVIDVLDKTDNDSFPGIHAFVADVREHTKGIDRAKPPGDWPPLDVDKLVANNPNFWRAVYEIAPSDPKLLLLHAGLLVAAGEMTRGLFVLQLGKWAPTWPEDLLRVLQQVQAHANNVLQRGDKFVRRGIERFDAGDRAAAKREYEDLLELWPNSSFAHYELGLTVMTDKLEAAGVKQKLKTIQINQSVPGVEEAAPHFRRARLHDPIRWEAYQGSDQTVIKGLQSLVKGREATDKLRSTVGSGKSDKMPDSVLIQFADACQGAAAHEYALVARQVLVARRGRFDPSDHPFFCTSLRALAPSDETETVLGRLAGAQLKMTQLTPPPARPPVAITEDPSGFAVQATMWYQPTSLMPKRIGSDVTPTANFIKAMKAAGQEYWATLPKSDGRAMMAIVFLKPDGMVKFWFTYRGDPLDDEIEQSFLERLTKLTPPPITDGPVVIGLLVNLWGGGPNPARAGPPPADLLFPKDWQDATKAADVKLQIPISDDVLKIIWPD